MYVGLEGCLLFLPVKAIPGPESLLSLVELLPKHIVKACSARCHVAKGRPASPTSHLKF